MKNAQIIDGRNLAKNLEDELKSSVNILKKQGKRPPHLSVILVGDNLGSQLYVKKKEEACLRVGMTSQTIRFPKSVSQENLLAAIDELNRNDAVDGILLQLPLPQQLITLECLCAIAPEKDVDGLTPLSQGKLALGEETLFPCTPLGIMTMLKHFKLQLQGKVAVVMGRSSLVGIPIARMLTREGATLIHIHSKTTNPRDLTRLADILVVAIGQPEFVDESFVKEGAVVIDVGINKVNNQIVGDVNFKSVASKVSLITPVPGGVGPMTIVSLLQNCLKAYDAKDRTRPSSF